MSWLEVHVFGSSSKGEGLILKLPDSKFAVVDCCFRGDINNAQTNPMVAYLKMRNVKRLAFVCLTHPHDDHYFGLSQILKSTPPEIFFRSAAMTPNRMHRILLTEQYDALKHGDTPRQRALRELVAIDSKWQEISDRKSQERVLGNLPIYPTRLPKSPSFKITGISPWDQEIDEYENALPKCVETDIPIGKSFGLQHNRISVGLLIECRKFNLVLGGDVEQNNWKIALSKFDRKRLESKFVKISHHGSKTGDCEELWEAFSAGGSKPIGVVTGYKSQGLPRQDMLKKFQRFTSELSCTHSQSITDAVLDEIVDRTLRATHRTIEEFLSIDSRERDLRSTFGSVRKI